MSASAAAYRKRTEEGWTDATLLSVVLDYIDNQQSDEAFEDHLEEHSAIDDTDEEE